VLRKIQVNSANRSLPGRYKLTLAAVLVSVLVFAAWQPVKNTLSTPEKEQDSTELNPVGSMEKANIPAGDVISDSGDDSADTSSEALDNSPSDELLNDSVNEYTITSGDTLAKVLEEQNVSFKDVFNLTKKFPALASELRPDQIISWVADEEGHLQSLTWTVNRKETRIYELTEEGFVETIELTKGEWREFVISGEIEPGSNLCSAAIGVGLSNRECQNAIRYLQYQVNLNALRAGDSFTFYIEREFVNNEYSGTRLLAAKMKHRKRDRYIVYFDKYKAYYDEEGKPLTDGFLRIPTLGEKQYRISSHFNPRRLHPVTKRVAPHNGVDFAMPTGTPLVAAGDGEVTIARFSPTAGNYVAIRHGKQYSTRYLHMSKLTVRPGQIVKRGDLIGYSGNTGRSTGPHLHYEFLIDNKHVDPMKMTLPRPEGLKNSDLKEFISYAETIKTKFDENFEIYLQEKAKAAEEEKVRAAEEKRKLEEQQAAEAAANQALAAEQAAKDQLTSAVEHSGETQNAETNDAPVASEAEAVKAEQPSVESTSEAGNVKPESENSAS
jgi:murein DD-endopeptidase